VPGKGREQGLITSSPARGLWCVISALALSTSTCSGTPSTTRNASSSVCNQWHRRWFLSGGQKAPTTGNQSVNAYWIPFEVIKLLSNELAYLVETGSLLLSRSKKLLPLPACEVLTRLMAKAFSDLRMHRINQVLSHLSDYSIRETSSRLGSDRTVG
jgi:hypothetical protein